MWLAHSTPPDWPEHGPQPYADHAREVERRARKNAVAALQFTTGSVGQKSDPILESIAYAAWFHDLGKLDDRNQESLRAGRGKPLKIDHIDAGVAHCLQQAARSAAILVRSHHSPGLPSLPNERFMPCGFLRGKRCREPEEEIHRELVEDTNLRLKAFLERHGEALSDYCRLPPAMNPSLSGLALRIALSCLVDADHNDTARWDSGSESDFVDGPPPSELLTRLDRYVSELGSGDSERNELRSSFFHHCKDLVLPGSIFSCEAGVGTGKSTSVTAFLLRQMAERGLRRLIYVAPFTNIIRQTARTFRKAFSNGNDVPWILENHHRVEFEDPESRQRSLLWKAPLVLTTALQFFETLGANRPAQLRKLHAVPGSAILIDESHASLPPHLWPQAWRWLVELAEEWSCCIVLASGSSLRIWENSDFVMEVRTLPEITPETVRHSSQKAEKRRVTFDSISNALGRRDAKAHILSDFEDGNGPVLAIFNTVQTAAVIAWELALEVDNLDALDPSYEAELSARRVLHLSTALSPSDREKVLVEIEKRNNEGDPNWILVATSCVEAGVDLDFQTGYRERCSVASFIQTSGRINRHDLRSGARLIDFRLITDSMITEHPAFGLSSQIMTVLWKEIEAQSENPATLVSKALEMEIDQTGGLSKELLDAESREDYPKVAERMRVIEGDTRTVVVNEYVAEQLLRHKRVSPAEIQMHSVQIWSRKIEDFGLHPIHKDSSIYAWHAPYDSTLLGIMQNVLIVTRANAGEGMLLVENRE